MINNYGGQHRALDRITPLSPNTEQAGTAGDVPVMNDTVVKGTIRRRSERTGSGSSKAESAVAVARPVRPWFAYRS